MQCEKKGILSVIPWSFNISGHFIIQHSLLNILQYLDKIILHL